MNASDAKRFIADAVGASAGSWADVGAGTGTFTRALQLLLPAESRIYAIDRDPAAIAALRRIGGVVAVQSDFTKTTEFADLGPASLDGMLLANALHFVPDPAVVLARLARLVKPRGRVVIVEYDRRAASPWVPFPIESVRWPSIAEAAGFVNPAVIARRNSAYAGELYVAVADKRQASTS
ncbi:MAG TPA: class I SAM-dependent methyltransferase [Gemmatimonadaceae bacterium]